MFDDSNIIAGLEIGTSVIRVAVGETGESGALNIIGLGQARSRGVRKGEIADAAYRFQRKVSADRMVVVGVNGFTGGNEDGQLPILSIGPEVEEAQRKRLAEVRLARSDDAVLIQGASRLDVVGTNAAGHGRREGRHGRRSRDGFWFSCPCRCLPARPQPVIFAA